MPDSPYKLTATYENFAADVVDASDLRPVLVDFWAPWCGPCQTLMPMLDRLADEYGGRFTLAKVNTDEQQEIAGHFGIRGLPTVMLLHKREIVQQFVGVQPENVYRSALDGIFGPEAVVEPAPESTTAAARSPEELESALAERPGDADLLAELADARLRLRDVAGAAQALERLSGAQAADRRLPALRARLALTQIVVASPDAAAARRALELDAADSAARHALAAHHALAGDHATALAEWLELMRRDRRYGDDAARRMLLSVFDLLGDAHELVGSYRRRMASLLH